MKNLLEKSTEELKLRAELLNDVTMRFNILESKMALLKGQLSGQHGVIELPNQTQRDAKMVELLQTDPRYEPLYREHLEARTESKIAFTNWILAQEVNKNLRALYMGGDIE